MKITQTRNYHLFLPCATNRRITEKDTATLTKLKRSMEKYGFLPFPIIVRRTGDRLVIIDGQHRYIIAQELKLPIYYVETERDDIVIAECADAQSAWKVFDYVDSFASQGNEQYKELLEFAKAHQLPLTVCANMLAGGLANNAGCRGVALKQGLFEIRDREMATRMAGIVSCIREYAHWITSNKSLNAISRFLRVKEFDDETFVKKVRSHSSMLRNQPTVEGMSEMYEEIYNYQSRTRYPLSFLAREAAIRRPNNTPEHMKEVRSHRRDQKAGD